MCSLKVESFVVRQARMSALGVKSLENAVDEVLALVTPFVQVHDEEWLLQVRQRLAAGVALVLALRWVLHEPIGSFVQEGLEETPALAVGCSPIAAAMSGDGLVEMAEWDSEVIAVEQAVNFIVGNRQVEGFWQGSPQLAVLDEVARAFQCPDEGCSKAMWVVGNVSGGFLHDKVGQEPFIAPGFGIVTQEPKKVAEPLVKRLSITSVELVKLPE